MWNQIGLLLFKFLSKVTLEDFLLNIVNLKKEIHFPLTSLWLEYKQELKVISAFNEDSGQY